MSWPVVTVEQMRALEAAAAARGLDEAQLQARAAAEIATVAERLTAPGNRIAVLIGPGNNGRDAFLAGRLLAGRQRPASYVLTPRHAIRDDELAALSPELERTWVFTGSAERPRLEESLKQSDLVLDGLLGIGVRGPMRPPLDQVAATVNAVAAAQKLRVVAVDVPSGIDADSGQMPGEAVRADRTIALGGVKAGTLRFPAAVVAGRIETRPIGLPAELLGQHRTWLLEEDEVGALVPDRPLDAHKGTLGWVMLVGGSQTYLGAPILSAASAARSGCGLVALAVPPEVQLAAAATLPEATYLLRAEGEAALAQTDRLLERLIDYRALIMGPGLGREAQTSALVRALLSRLRDRGDRPTIVLDADALFALAAWPDWWRAVPPGCVLTPHVGEMARLTGLTAQQISAAAWETATEAASRWEQIVLLKGPHTTVALPDGRAWVYPRPNPGLATAGTGDVLAGLVGGLAAQGLEAGAAARLAVVVHAIAARNVLEARRWRSLLASDLLLEIPAVLRSLRG